VLGSDGSFHLDPTSARAEQDPYLPGAYEGGNFYNGDDYLVGEAISPVVLPSFGFSQAIVSWNADTPNGSWIEALIQARIGTRWTKWYNLGVWAANNSMIERHSVRLQGDSDGFVAVDTLVLSSKKTPANAYQLKLRLFSEDGIALPAMRNVSVAISTTPSKPSNLAPGNPDSWDKVLSVPECSQMVYPDGGEVWCSPTSTSMVLAYWEQLAGNAIGPCEPRVRDAVEGVFDRVYDGHGNWPFNTAYAATHGLEGYVARFTSLAQAEKWIDAGVPVIISYAWKKSSLTGAPISSSGGHLAVLVGFDATGDPIVNDPAAASNETVQRAYDREQLESLWLEHSGGTVYLVYPPGKAVPALN
jgi:hypothetical protein